MSKVSVIMPTYNRKNMIGRAIESVLNQTFKDYELIIVDDGSTDGTEENLRKIVKENSRIYYFKQENKGPSSARNFGISKAKGNYLAFLDTDNIWHPNFLEVMMDVLEKNPDYMMAYGSQNLLLVSPSKKGELSIIARKVRSEKYNSIRLTNENFIDVNSVVLRTKVFDELGGFDESLKSLEDWDLFARIAIRHPFKIMHVDQVLMDYYYSENFDTVTNKAMPKKAIRAYMGKRKPDKNEEKVLGKIEKYLSENK